eukprot:94548_1
MTVANSIIYYLCLSSVILATVLSIELDSIGEYELIHIDIDNQNEKPIIAFTAFSTQYKIELTPNNQFIPANIHRTNGNPTVRDGNVPYYTSQTTTCHYFGALLETNITGIVSVSMCQNHGIRVHIRTQTGDVIIIEPSAPILDPNNKNSMQLFTDQHIVYKSTDAPIDLNQFSTNKRRLAKKNNGKSYVEILLFFDPTLVRHYKDQYGSSWYENLESHMISAVNIANNAYLAANWYDNDSGEDVIGQISLHVIEIEVIETHNQWTTGKYAGLKPIFSTDGCSESNFADYRDTKRCHVNSNNWLGKIVQWCKANKDPSKYDNVAMFGRIKLSGLVGLARAKRMCIGFESVSTNFFFNDDLTAMASTFAHETGHVLGAQTHTPKTSPSYPDIMGGESFDINQHTIKQITDYFNGKFLKSDGTTDTWMTNKFNNNGGISCLANVPSNEIIVDPPENSICCDCNKAKPQGQKGCSADLECQTKICDADKYCCNNHWDQNCANAANREAKICLDLPETSICCECSSKRASGEKGCPVDAACQGTICTGDIYCCNNHWDQNCANAANREAKICLDLPETSICCECSSKRASGEKGCPVDAACQGTICTGDIYCCNNHWDQVCANAATKVCTNGNSAFTSVDCLDNNEYSDYLCVSRDGESMNNVTLFDGDNTLKLHGSCANDRPIWYFSVTESDVDGRNGTVTRTYYLHYDTYVTAYMNERMHEWIISVDEISTVGIAICAKENVFACQNGSWIVDETNGDYVESVIEPTMNIINQGCNGEGIKASEVESGDAYKIGRTIALCVLALICVVVGIGFYICYKKRSRNKGVVTFEKKGIEENEIKESETNLKGDNGEEIEVEVEVEVEMET